MLFSFSIVSLRKLGQQRRGGTEQKRGRRKQNRAILNDEDRSKNRAFL
jgi:hypothetical protein